MIYLKKIILFLIILASFINDSFAEEKNNNNHQRVLLLRKMFPESRIIIPFRDPSQHSRSLYDQHIMFKKKQANDDFIRKYMDYLGHNEFGEGYQAIHTNTRYNYICIWIFKYCN